MVRDAQGPSAQIEAGEWMVAAGGVDVARRRGVAYLKGAEVANIRLPEGFRLEIATSQAKQRDEVRTLTYPWHGGFHGLVDELIIYDRVLSAEEFASTPLKP